MPFLLKFFGLIIMQQDHVEKEFLVICYISHNVYFYYTILLYYCGSEHMERDPDEVYRLLL